MILNLFLTQNIHLNIHSHNKYDMLILSAVLEVKDRGRRLFWVVMRNCKDQGKDEWSKAENK